MKMNKCLSCSVVFVLLISHAFAQTKKFDTTVKMGDNGYRVECSNKAADENYVTVSLIGLRLSGNNPTFKIYGRVMKAFTDDFNNDGHPDLAICVYNGTNNEIGTIACLSYTADKSLVPIYFPDIYLDAKLREGYKGYDEFSALTGTLLRKFPIYLTGDEMGKPTGGTRTIQYNVATDQGRLSFKVLRSFDVKQ
ncbi:MAG: hypothetical protein ABI405_01210 [Parafilimonas sp.]